MNKTAFVFPGQGAQYAGMGKEFYENFNESKDIFERANEALGFDIAKICFEGSNEDLSVTKITQPAILTVCMAIYEVIKNNKSNSFAMGGLSLGEYSALTASGAIDFETAVKLVYNRGNYMQNAVPVGEGGMLALLGCSDEDAIRFCNHVTNNCDLLEPANFNCPGQIAAGGKSNAIEYALKETTNFNIKKAVKLQVSAPFHTSMLKPAGNKLKEDLLKVNFKRPECNVVSNVDTEYYQNEEEIKSKLEKQVYNPVRWEACVRKMIADGVNTFVEIGPGKTLCSFIKKIDKSVKFINIENIETLNKYLELSYA
ncbi:ACP S-malonyltransferase [Sedimentibacter sp. MB31-C6]|uniref:ACP S-malonyltransferase n=1 Tax=Sedimentibacter sp. MB31-C6 TaxID=3109366 RepID=UPI002DDD5BD2|nr:ACP S-malonyltransferase [Sedimentibacter sp. MB36-C1]WSI05361.1 ACP S-malonyltransferase [Sedimentibacter sp. MB36-C1]